MSPYTDSNEISDLVGKLPLHMYSKGYEVRVLMPRFGLINERRHRLHEVVRLSGMNIIVDDDDYPLIIKVASLPGARLQVYFLDNDEFFKRKNLFNDDEGTPYEDNAERMVFFCKGVIETVRKFGWPPDIIHCHGWMTSMIPMFIRQAYKSDPVFHETQILYSAYPHEMNGLLQDNFISKASINNLSKKDLDIFVSEGNISLERGAFAYADACIKGSVTSIGDVDTLLDESNKPVLRVEDEATYLNDHLEFYKMLTQKNVPT